MTTVFMVDSKRFHFDYDRPAVLPRWADRETVLNLGRSFFGCIMWSKQDPFQIQIRPLRPTRFPHGLAASNLAPLPAPTHELNLARSLPAFFSEVSLYPIHLRQLNRIVDEES
jgi:hypothetical protein